MTNLFLDQYFDGTAWVYSDLITLCLTFFFFFVLVHLKLGDVADPHAPVWIQLLGEKGESGQIQIKPGYGPEDKFEKDRTYKVVARVTDIGRVRNKTEVFNYTCAWLILNVDVIFKEKSRHQFDMNS